MSGLTAKWTDKYWRRRKLKEAAAHNEFNKEGVFYSVKSKKFVVRVKNKSRSKNSFPFISAAQFDDKRDAEKRLKELTT